MTDKARDLLERALEALDFDRGIDADDLMEEIRAYLAQPEQDEEPVASQLADELHYAQEITFEGCGYKLISPEDADEIVAELRRLHPAPRQEFVRLSEEEVSEILSSAHTPYEAICAAENRLERKNK